MKKIVYLIVLFLPVAVYAQKDSLLKSAANIDGLTGGAITIQQFRDAKEISVSDNSYVVEEYRFSAYAKDKEPVEMDFHTNAIPDKLKEIVAQLPPGNTKMYFEYIRAVDAKGNKLVVSPIAFTLSK